ncbi:Uncharacterized protein FKW44_011474 [Caligus rogercresseyi]|uniref:Uncharacterized protein n=1 Tax=Caligus rogercresseyi TaxID=217165 RepID=A0A7T8HI31_CALRO|nr:Uncharacterized protein FKW44_011474 [Caligus rogercresseyi]
MVLETIWDLAVAHGKQCEKRSDGEETLLLIGNQGVGKSTMMARFVDRREAPSPLLP